MMIDWDFVIIIIYCNWFIVVNCDLNDWSKIGYCFIDWVIDYFVDEMV